MGTYDDWKTRAPEDDGPQEEPEDEPVTEEMMDWAVTLADYVERHSSEGYRLIDRIAHLTKLTGRDLEQMVELVEDVMHHRT